MGEKLLIIHRNSPESEQSEEVKARVKGEEEAESIICQVLKILQLDLILVVPGIIE